MFALYWHAQYIKRKSQLDVVCQTFALHGVQSSHFYHLNSLGRSVTFLMAPATCQQLPWHCSAKIDLLALQPASASSSTSEHGNATSDNNLHGRLHKKQGFLNLKPTFQLLLMVLEGR